MMFGFRVYELRATEGPTKTKPKPVEDPLGDGVSLVDRVRRSSAGLARHGLLTRVPNLQFPWHHDLTAPAEQGDPQTLFRDFTAIGATNTLFKMDYGLRGEFDSAYGDADVVDMRKRSAAITFRVLMVLPAGGEFGRLVVESKGTRCPVSSFVSWLGYEDYSHGSRWVRMRVKQIGDQSRLEAMARNADAISAKLTRRQPGAPGDGGGEIVTLTHKTRDEIKKQGMIGEAIAWLRGDRDEGVIHRVEQIAGYDPEKLDHAGLRFDRAVLEIEKDGVTKTINSNTIAAKFTYPASYDLQLDDETWLLRVREVLEGPLSEGTDIVL